MKRREVGNPQHRLGLRLGTAVALLACAVACGGGGGGDDEAPVICPDLSFVRALVTPSSGDVYFEQSIGNCSSIEVSVLVSNLSGIFTAGFDLTFPSSLLQYDSYTLGPLLLKGNPQTAPFVLVTPMPGGLQVSMTRFGPDPPVTAVGSEALITFKFMRTSSGAGAIDFDTNSGSAVGESILDDSGVARPAVFAPGHGGMATVP
jgi:hypothetical protein